MRKRGTIPKHVYTFHECKRHGPGRWYIRRFSLTHRGRVRLGVFGMCCVPLASLRGWLKRVR